MGQMDPTLQQPQRPAPVNGEGSRTSHVIVAPQITHASTPPELGQTQSSEASASAQTSSPHTVQKPFGPQINWGGVAKGAAIIAGVVLVGVVGAWLLSGVILPAVISTTLGAEVVGGLATGASTALDIGAGVAQVGWSSLTTVAGGLAEGFGASAALPGPIMAAQNAFGTVAGWVGGIGASLIALPLALKQFAMIQFMDPAMTVGADMTAANTATATTAASKAIAIHQHPTQHITPHDHHSAAAQLGSTPDPSDALLDDSAMQASTKAMKVVHHAAEDQHHYKQHKAAQAILARSALASKSWAERVGPATPQPVQASARPPIAPRATNYTEQAELEKQLLAGKEGSLV